MTDRAGYRDGFSKQTNLYVPLIAKDNLIVERFIVVIQKGV